MYLSISTKAREYSEVTSLARLIGKKFLPTILIVIFCSIDTGYSSPPDLPPILPKSEKAQLTTTDEQQKTDSLLKRMKKFINTKNTDKSPAMPTITPQDTIDENNNTGSFIDLGDNKLPSLGETTGDNKLNPYETNQPVQIPAQENEKNIINSTIPKDIPNLSNQPVPTSPAVITDNPPISDENKNSETLPNQIMLPASQGSVPRLPQTPAPNAQPSALDAKIINDKDAPAATLPNPDKLPASQGSAPSFPQTSAPNAQPLLPEINSTPKIIKPSEVSPKQSRIGDKIPATLQSQPIVPVFVEKKLMSDSNNNIEKEADNNLSIGKELDNNLSKDEDVNNRDNSKIINDYKESSPELAQFIQDETQMLLLPNDDMVLGTLTEGAILDQMDLYSFINMFKKIYDNNIRKKQRVIINNFIDNYGRDFRTNKDCASYNGAINRSFDAVKKDNLFALRALLDNYPIIQKTGAHQYSLLHEVSETNSYYLAKFLIMRGINLNAIDYRYRTALTIANEQHNNVSCLIRKALR